MCQSFQVIKNTTEDTQESGELSKDQDESQTSMQQPDVASGNGILFMRMIVH